MKKLVPEEKDIVMFERHEYRGNLQPAGFGTVYLKKEDTVHIRYKSPRGLPLVTNRHQDEVEVILRPNLR